MSRFAAILATVSPGPRPRAAGRTGGEAALVAAGLLLVGSAAAATARDAWLDWRVREQATDIDVALREAGVAARTAGRAAGVAGIGGDFSAGWQVFLDYDDNGAIGKGDVVLSRVGAAPDDVTLRGPRDSVVRFDARGQARAIDGRSPAVSVCSAAGFATKAIRVVATSGEVAQLPAEGASC